MVNNMAHIANKTITYTEGFGMKQGRVHSIDPYSTTQSKVSLFSKSRADQIRDYNIKAREIQDGKKNEFL